MNLGTRLNNWSNIRYSPRNNWHGQIGSIDGFVNFATVADWRRAFRILLCNYLIEGHNTITSVIERYAPSEENDTEAYIANVSEWTGIDPHRLLSKTDIPALMKAMTRKETGNVLSDDDMTEIAKELGV